MSRLPKNISDQIQRGQKGKCFIYGKIVRYHRTIKGEITLGQASGDNTEKEGGEKQNINYHRIAR
jgi:hypothetical protein